MSNGQSGFTVLSEHGDPAFTANVRDGEHIVVQVVDCYGKVQVSLAGFISNPSSGYEGIAVDNGRPRSFRIADIEEVKNLHAALGDAIKAFPKAQPIAAAQPTSHRRIASTTPAKKAPRKAVPAATRKRVAK